MASLNVEKYLRNEPVIFKNTRSVWATSEMYLAKALSTTKMLSGVLPLGIASKYVSLVYLTVRYGPLVAYSSEAFTAISLLVKLLKSMESEVGVGLRSTASVALGMYYRMAENYGERGTFPHLEREKFLRCKIGKPDDLHAMLLCCSLATHVGYVECPVEAQQLLNSIYGLDLLWVGRHGTGEFNNYFFARSAFFLAIDSKTRELYVILPGTKTVADVSVDLNAFSEAIKGGTGKAHRGVARAADNVFEAIFPSVDLLVSQGGCREIFVTGHSLGAAIGALLAVKLRTLSQLQNFSNSEKKYSVNLHCYSFGAPPCMDEVLANECQSYVTSVVLRDDMICRASVQNVQLLIEELNNEETSNRVWNYVKHDWAEVKRLVMWKKNRNHTEAIPNVESIQTTVSNPAGFIGSYFSRLKMWMHVPKAPVVPKRNFYLPGKIYHIYMRNGVYSGGYVSRAHASLNRVEIQPNMIDDHFAFNYFRALLQIAEKNECKRGSVEWKSFASSNACSCCGTVFQAAGPLRGIPHVHLAKKVCRKCGDIVCDTCSKNRKPVPEIGVLWPVRCCDKCWMTGCFRGNAAKL